MLTNKLIEQISTFESVWWEEDRSKLGEEILLGLKDVQIHPKPQPIPPYGEHMNIKVYGEDGNMYTLRYYWCPNQSNCLRFFYSLCIW